MRKLCFPSIPPVKHKPVDNPRTDCAKPPANPHPRFLYTRPRFTRNRCPQCSKVRKPLIRHANPHLCTKLVPVNYYYYPCIHILGLTALSGQRVPAYTGTPSERKKAARRRPVQVETHHGINSRLATRRSIHSAARGSGSTAACTRQNANSTASRLMMPAR